MQRYNSSPSPWFFLPPETEPSASYRRSNLIAIAILVFFAIGLLVIAFLPENTRGSALATGHPQSHVGKSAPPVQHIR
jgi:hypothetical protein